MLFVIHYRGHYCMHLQIVRVKSFESARETADAFLLKEDGFHSVTIQKLDVEGNEAIVYEAGYDE